MLRDSDFKLNTFDFEFNTTRDFNSQTISPVSDPDSGSETTSCNSSSGSEITSSGSDFNSGSETMSTGSSSGSDSNSETKSSGFSSESGSVSDSETTSPGSDSGNEPITGSERTFSCFPLGEFKTLPEMDSGNKIIMPPSYLSQLIDSDAKFPYLFQIKASGAASHCGVLEFTAEEGRVHAPRWMMDNLGVEEGGEVELRHAELPAAEFMRLRPHAAAFLELANPRAVLERKLRGFACLSGGDTIPVKHNGVDFYLDVLEVLPGSAVSLIETDCEVDFAPPLDREAERDGSGGGVQETEGGVGEVVIKEFRPFMGAARRLDGAVAAAVEKAPAQLAGKKRKRDGGGKEEFKPFTGRSRVLGGDSIDS